MTKINTIETTLKALHDGVQKLINGELDQQGFDLLVNDSKELYEKMIILRYKAYEEKIFGVNAVPSEAVSAKEETIAEVRTEEKQEASFFDDIEKVIPIEEKAETEVPKDEVVPEAPKEAPSFDFSLFEDDKEEAAAETESVISEEPEKEEAVPANEDKIILDEDLPSFDMESDEELAAPSVQEEVQSQEIKEEQIEEPQVITDEKASIIEQAPFKPSSAEPAPAMEEEKLSSTENWVQEQFISKFSKIDADEVQQLSISKLSTLLGAFGLNERLQCINELFDGSSEAFSEAIKTLDNAGNLEAAIKIASEFAIEHEWDLNSETVEEFVFKIKRRYA